MQPFNLSRGRKLERHLSGATTILFLRRTETPEVAEFKAAFDRAQAELVTMLKALRKVQAEEVKTKLTQAAETMLGNFSRQIGG